MWRRWQPLHTRSRVQKVSNEDGSLRLIEFAAKVHAGIRDQQEIRSLQSSSAPPLLRNPDTSCILGSESIAGEENVGGYEAIKIQSNGRTSWFARRHGCALVRELWKFETGEVSEKTLISLVGGIPDSGLFHIPKSYKEVPPSVMIDPTGRKVRPVERRFALRDKHYYENRPVAIPE